MRRPKPVRARRTPPPRVVPSQAPGGVYLPTSLQLVQMIGSLGASDDEIEKVYGLGSGTLAKWRKHYPGLNKALEQGRTKADLEVLAALHKTAVGFHEFEEQAVGGKHPTVLKVQRYFPGQFLAQKHWLANRQRENWPAREQIEHTGRNGEPIKVESRNDLIDTIVAMVSSKIDPEKQKDGRESRAS